MRAYRSRWNRACNQAMAPGGVNTLSVKTRGSLALAVQDPFGSMTQNITCCCESLASSWHLGLVCEPFSTTPMLRILGSRQSLLAALTADWADAQLQGRSKPATKPWLRRIRRPNR